MEISNEIDILRLDHVLGLSQTSIEIHIGFEILILSGRALPSKTLYIYPTPIGNQKFLSTQISILTADLKSAENPDSFFPMRNYCKT